MGAALRVKAAFLHLQREACPSRVESGCAAHACTRAARTLAPGVEHLGIAQSTPALTGATRVRMRVTARVCIALDAAARHMLMTICNTAQAECAPLARLCN